MLSVIQKASSIKLTTFTSIPILYVYRKDSRRIACYNRSMKKAGVISKDVFSTPRMEALTDGVFAIAMTLLILDINVKDFGDITSSAQLWAELVENNTGLISFTVSFLLLGSMWAVHMRQFEYIKRTDRYMTMINNLRLLAVVFVPLTTSIGGAFSNTELGRVLLPLNFLVLAVITYWEWVYAVNSEHLANKVPDKIKRQASIRNLTIVFIGCIVTILSIFIEQWAFLVFIIMPLLTSYLQKRFA